MVPWTRSAGRGGRKKSVDSGCFRGKIQKLNEKLDIGFKWK